MNIKILFALLLLKSPAAASISYQASVKIPEPPELATPAVMLEAPAAAPVVPPMEALPTDEQMRADVAVAGMAAPAQAEPERATASGAPASYESLEHIGESARELVRAVIQARDPRDLFEGVQAVRFPLKLSGRFFRMQGNEEAFSRPGVTVTVWTKKRKVMFDNFPKPGQTSVYLEKSAYTRSRSGEISWIARPLERIRFKSKKGGLALKADAYEQFEGGGLFGAVTAPFRIANAAAGNPFGGAGRLTALEQMSFMSYALINYMLFPNVLLDPDKVQSVEKTGPYELTVTYRRKDFPTNSKVQVYRFDPENLLLALHLYQVSYIDKGISAYHRILEHKSYGGIFFAARRRVRVALLGQATADSPMGIKGDFGPMEVLREDPDKAQ